MQEIKKTFGLRRILIISFGVLLMTCGLHYFLVPNNLMVGGATGVAMILSSVIPAVPMSLSLLVINIVLFVIGFLVLGRNFGGLTVFASLLTSGILSVLERLSPMTQGFTEDLLINLIFGAGLMGVGVGVVLNQGASTGGSDILGKILNKFTQLTMGASLLIIDGLICLGAGFIYGPAFGMYAILGVFISSAVIDRVLRGLDTLYDIMIVSKDHEAINDFILNQLKRASTIYNVKGGYSGTDRVLVQTVLPKRSYVRLRNFIRSQDPQAFLYVSTVSEVTGEGFTFELTEEPQAERRGAVRIGEDQEEGLDLEDE